MNPPGSYMGVTIDWGAVWAQLGIAAAAIAAIAAVAWLAVSRYQRHKAWSACEEAAIRRARAWAKGGAR